MIHTPLLVLWNQTAIFASKTYVKMAVVWFHGTTTSWLRVKDLVCCQHLLPGKIDTCLISFE